MNRWKPCLATLLLAGTLAACGKPAAQGGPAAPVNPTMPAPAAPVSADPSCPKASGPVDPTMPPHATGGVPADFVTSWVMRCRFDLRDKPGQGKWSVQIAERADTPATELVAQLRRPSDARTDGSCTMELRVPPFFVLVDAAGHGIAPAVPTDTCGKPRLEAIAELDKLPYRMISETPLNQVQSPQSQQTGCSDGYKDMITISAKDARRTGPTPALPRVTNTVVVCFYDRITNEQIPVGSLSTTRTIEGDAANNLLAALDEAGPAADCSAPHTRFALLTGTGGQAVVELDGCHRLLRADNTLGQLDAATVALLS